MGAVNEENICAKCGIKENSRELHYCFGCKKCYCSDCVKLTESDDCYSNYVKYYVNCPIDKKHHMNSTWSP